MKNIIEILEEQPISEALKPNVPVSYFLINKINHTEKSRSQSRLAKSSFHNTEIYFIDSFYKIISNII